MSSSANATKWITTLVLMMGPSCNGEGPGIRDGGLPGASPSSTSSGDDDGDGASDDPASSGMPQTDGGDEPPADTGTPPPGDTGSQPPPRPFEPQPVGCVTSVDAGLHEFTCDGLATTVAVPDACTQAPCGVILDVHGASMSAAQQDANTNMRALGQQYGFIVVQPTTDSFSWMAGHEVRIMNGLFDVNDAFAVDESRVHVTGFSAGGGVTWVILCAYPEVFASAAPAAATGQYFGAAPVCFGSNPPSPELDILYINGELDPFEPMHYVDQLVGKIVADWAMDPGVTIDGDGTFERVQHTNANGTTFELLTHQYETDQSVIGIALAGHCYPGSTDHAPSLPGQLAGYGCKGSHALHYGETVVQFFVDNPS